MTEVARLEAEPGFTADAFCARVGEFVSWFVELIQRTAFYGRTGWAEHLEAYVWDDRGWRETLALREHLGARLVTGDATAVGELFEWAHMDDMDAVDVASLLESRAALDRIDEGDWAGVESIPASRVASTSKVYSTSALDAWSIYDSRVANALAFGIDRWWRETDGPRAAELLSLRMPRSRESATGSYVRVPPETFRGLDQKAPIQARLSLIYSSWLIRCIARRLSERSEAPDGGNRWRPVHVEMVLFMLGLDTRRLT